MLLTFDFASDVPLYQQLRNQIVLGIADGRLRAGEKLPTVRALAEESGVNTMTVSKAYQLLKAEGYLKSDRHSGTVIAARDGRRAATPEQRERLRLCISELRLGGMTREDLLALCAECYGGEEQ